MRPYEQIIERAGLIVVSDPLLSIVTPCFNRAGFVAEAIESVRDQGVNAVEHIVIDGGSTDGTLEVLARYPDVIVVSEPDDGLYDALNKGLRMARGSIIGHLNTDDIYPPGAFFEVLDAFARNPDVEMVCGGAAIVAADEGTAGWRTLEEFGGPEHCDLDWDLVMKGPILTNARFYRRAVFERVGFFDTRYRIIGDRDFLLRAALAGIRGAAVDRTVCLYRQHAGSLTFDVAGANALKGYDEKLAIATDHLSRLSLNADLSKRYQAWHRYETGRAFITALSQHRFGKAFGYLLEGFRHSPAWPLHVCILSANHALAAAAVWKRRFFGRLG